MIYLINIPRILIIVLMIGIGSCQSKKVLIVDGSNSKKLDFGCGKIIVDAIYGSGKTFGINFYVTSTKSISVLPESLEILHRQKKVDYTFLMTNKGNAVNNNLIGPGEGRQIQLLVDKFSVPYGDTLLIKPPEFLSCQSECILCEPIQLVLLEIPAKPSSNSRNL